MHPVIRLRQSSRSPLLQAAKTAVAVIAAVLACKALLHGPFPTFAAIAALLVIQPSVNQSFVRGVERSAGVIIGVILSTAVHALFGGGTAVVLFVIVLAIIIGWALRLTPTSATQIGISGLLVITTGLVTPNYAFDRIIETIVGAAVALVVNAVLVPPVLIMPVHLSLARLGRDTAAAFERLAIGLTEGWTKPQWNEALVEARELRQQQSRTEGTISAARESLTMNPRSRRNREILVRDADTARRMSVLVTRAIGMTRAVHDNVTPDLIADQMVGRIATELARIAGEVRQLAAQLARMSDTRRVWPPARSRDDESEVDTADDIPALTAPMPTLQPNEEHWILIGSLLEDIRRIREELLGENG